MKKKLYFLIYLVFLMPTFSYGINKVAIVDLFRVFQQSSRNKIVSEKLKSEFQIRAIELQNLEQDLEKNIRRLNQYNSSDLYKNERLLLEREIIRKREIYAKKLRTFEEDNQRRQIEERNKILNYLKKIIKEISIKEGYDFVINSEAVVYTNQYIRDITEDILKRVK